jgi:hypothetical protein
MANNITIQDDYVNSGDLALLQGAADELTAGDIVGTILKYKKGIWQKKHNDNFINVTATQQFIVDMRSYQHGWYRWFEKRPTHRFMGRIVDGYPLWDRRQLPEKELINTEEDLWQETHQIVMRDLGGDDCPKPTHDGLCTYTCTSYHGRKALGRLLKAYGEQVKDHAGMMPVVYLGSKSQSGMKGTVDVPVYTIIDWQPFGTGASLPGHRLAMKPALPLLTYDGDDDDSGDGFGRPTQPTGKVVVMSKGKVVSDDPDDEIPF